MGSHLQPLPENLISIQVQFAKGSEEIPHLSKRKVDQDILFAVADLRIDFLTFLCDKPNCVKVCKYCYSNKERIPACTAFLSGISGTTM